MKSANAVRRLLFGGRTTDSFASTGLLIFRLVAGFGLILHGIPKLMAPMHWSGDQFPAILQLLAVISEVGGGIAWILGLLVPLASLGVGITMMTGIALAHMPFRDPIYRITVSNSNEGPGTAFFGLPPWLARGGGHSLAGSGSAELALLYFIMAVCLFFTGPGLHSVEATAMGWRKQK